MKEIKAWAVESDLGDDPEEFLTAQFICFKNDKYANSVCQKGDRVVRVTVRIEE